MSLTKPLDAQALQAWDSFQDMAFDFDQSIAQMLNHPGRAATAPPAAAVRSASSVGAIRLQTGLSQMLFAQLLGVSVRTLQEWEQGRRTPSGAAQTLLMIAQRHPEVLRELLV